MSELVRRRFLMTQFLGKIGLFIRRIAGELRVHVVDAVGMSGGNPELRSCRGIQGLHSRVLISRQLRGDCVIPDRIGVDAGVGVNKDAFGGKALGAVTGNGIAVVEIVRRPAAASISNPAAAPKIICF